MVNAIKNQVQVLDTVDGTDFIAFMKKVTLIIGEESGNVFESKQLPMVSNRLKKRMSTLGFSDVSDYEAYFNLNKSTEVQELVGLLTTHHTFFFREFVHFEFVQNHLAELVKAVKARGENCLKVWSAACSRGQEVYSLAMLLKHQLKTLDPTMTFKILGTDIDSKTVDIAINAVYHEREIKEIPTGFLADHVVKGKDDISNYYKFKKVITSHCHFQKFNLLQDKYSSLGKFDLVFCRNVLIYFKDQDTLKVVNSLKEVMYDTSYLITGLSESLVGRSPDVHSLGSSCYTFHKHKKDNKDKQVTLTSVTSISSQIEAPQIKKVLCVDDSPSVLKILSTIFTKEHGFEIVGNAKNGLEAEAFLKNHQIDLMTLDIHMPEMDGVTYLRKNFRFGKHPPVLMISSVSRSDDNLAQKALAFGASDFVEKPSLADMEQITLEIRMKAKVCIYRSNEKNQISSFDNLLSQNKSITNLEGKLLVIQCSLLDRYKILDLLKEREKFPTPAIIIVPLEDSVDKKQLLFENLSSSNLKLKFNADLPKVVTSLNANEVYFVDQKTLHTNLTSFKQKRDILFMVYGTLGEMLKKNISQLAREMHFCLEEMPENNEFAKYARDFVPATTMPYLIGQYFTRDKNEKVA